LQAAVEVGPGRSQEELPRFADAALARPPGRLARPPGLPLVELLEQRHVQVGLAGEVVVEAADAGARPGDDLADPGLRITHRDEHLTGGAQQGCPGGRAAIGGPHDRLRNICCHSPVTAYAALPTSGARAYRLTRPGYARPSGTHDDGMATAGSTSLRGSMGTQASTAIQGRRSLR